MLNNEFTCRDQKDSLHLVEGSVADLLIEEGRCVGILLQDGTALRSKSVVMTTGTFLGGECFIGENYSVAAGRFMRHEEYETGAKSIEENGDEKMQEKVKSYIKIEPASEALTRSIKKL